MRPLQQKITPADTKDIAAWALQQKFDALHLDCMTAVMLKILDNKCQMHTEVQQLFIAIYRVIEKNESNIFDLEIHNFINQVFKYPDPLSLRHIHELRLYAESSIEKSVMKEFKQSYSFLMNS
jgi:hypothetical protein